MGKCDASDCPDLHAVPRSGPEHYFTSDSGLQCLGAQNGRSIEATNGKPDGAECTVSGCPKCVPVCMCTCSVCVFGYMCHTNVYVHVCLSSGNMYLCICVGQSSQLV